MVWDFTEDEIVDAIRVSNYEAKKAVSYLLYGPSSTSTSSKSKTTPSKSSSKPTPSKPAPKTSTPSNPPPPAKKEPAAANKGQGNKVNISALAADLCAPVETSVPQLNPSNPSEASGIHCFRSCPIV